MSASNPQLYARANVYVNSSLLTEAFSLTVARNTNNVQMFTIAKGWAGITPGSGITEITVESQVPAAEFELNPDKFMEDNKVVEFTVFAESTVIGFKGFINTDNFAFASNGEAKLSFTATGSFSVWEKALI